MITDDERRLSERLWTLTLPESTVDVTAAMATGRRVRRRRAVAAGASATLAVLGLATVVATRPAPEAGPAATAGCAATRLPLPGGVVMDTVIDVDPTGRYAVGVVRTTDGTYTGAVRWDGTDPVVVPGEGHRTPFMVSADGVVLGAGTQGGFRYAAGQVTGLPAPAGYTHAVPSWLTPDGDPAGYAIADPATPVARVVWRAGEPSGVTPQAAGAHLRSSAEGTTVWKTGDGTGLVVSTPDGARRALDLPAGLRLVHLPSVAGDRAVGIAEPASGPPIAETRDSSRLVSLRWDLSTGAVEWRGDPGTIASSVAADGTMVLRTADGVAGLRYPDGTGRRLATPAGSTVRDDPVVSEDGGTVAGVTIDGAGRADPVVWHC